MNGTYGARTSLGYATQSSGVAHSRIFSREQSVADPFQPCSIVGVIFIFVSATGMEASPSDWRGAVQGERRGGPHALCLDVGPCFPPWRGVKILAEDLCYSWATTSFAVTTFLEVRRVCHCRIRLLSGLTWRLVEHHSPLRKTSVYKSPLGLIEPGLRMIACILRLICS